MLFDFNEAWPRVAEAQYDVCICGTGPAGITIARTLAARGKKVLLLEAGGLSFSDESQDHYEGRNVGRTYWIKTSRDRYIGGTSNSWSGLCILQDPITFEPTKKPSLPGWPIAYEQVISGIHEAKEIFNIAGKDISRSKYPGFMSFDRVGLALSSPTNFFEKYGSDLRQSQQIDTFYNANVIDLTLSDNLTRVNSIRLRNYNGQITDVSTAQCVLALGGIVNAGLHLNASRRAPAGIGNHSGMVGRCFMEGLNVPIGRFLVTDLDFWKDGSIGFVPTEAFMRQNNIGNGIISLYPAIS